MKFKLKLIFLIFTLFLGQIVLPIEATPALAQLTSLEEEQRLLQEQLEAYEREIDELNAKIADAKKQGSTLQGEVNLLNNRIAKINVQIRAITASIAKYQREISSTNNQIKKTENNIEFSRQNLINTLKNIYFLDRQDTVEVLLQSDRLSDFFGNVANLGILRDNLRDSLAELAATKTKLEEEKEQLDLLKADAEKIKRYQDAQRARAQKIQRDKNTLLRVTRGQESIYKTLVTEKQKAAAEIRTRIFRLLGGGELQFGDAVRIAQVAERATGVRAAFILAILTQESAVAGVIGANLGRCYYNTPRNNASGTVMSNSQKPAFLRIMAGLGRDPNTTPVSCPIVSDGAYGGAMGPSQFMPTTWELYDDRVSAITGGIPANPFNNLDAFTATALYLKDGLVGCRAIYKTVFSQENCAAAKYYAGGNWRRYITQGRYGYRVAERAAGFQEDIEILTQG